MKPFHRKPNKIVLGAILLSLFPALGMARTFLCGEHIQICLYYLLTGKPCLFCGLTRAIACAAVGDFNAAFTYHPFWWLAVIIMITLAFTLLVDGILGTDLSRFFTKIFYYTPLWMIIAVLVILSLLRGYFS